MSSSPLTQAPSPPTPQSWHTFDSPFPKMCREKNREKDFIVEEQHFYDGSDHDTNDIAQRLDFMALPSCSTESSASSTSSDGEATFGVTKYDGNEMVPTTIDFVVEKEVDKAGGDRYEKNIQARVLVPTHTAKPAMSPFALSPTRSPPPATSPPPPLTPLKCQRGEEKENDQIDEEVLAALPEDIRNEIIESELEQKHQSFCSLEKKQKTSSLIDLDLFSLPQIIQKELSQEEISSSSSSSLEYEELKFPTIPDNFASSITDQKIGEIQQEYDPEILEQLPEEIQREILENSTELPPLLPPRWHFNSENFSDDNKREALKTSQCHSMPMIAQDWHGQQHFEEEQRRTPNSPPKPKSWPGHIRQNISRDNIDTDDHTERAVITPKKHHSSRRNFPSNDSCEINHFDSPPPLPSLSSGAKRSKSHQRRSTWSSSAAALSPSSSQRSTAANCSSDNDSFNPQIHTPSSSQSSLSNADAAATTPNSAPSTPIQRPKSNKKLSRRSLLSSLSSSKRLLHHLHHPKQSQIPLSPNFPNTNDDSSNDNNSSGKIKVRYMGECDIKGQYKGEGEIHWENGDVFKGRFVEGLRNGAGSLSLHDGSSYEGNWKNDAFDGYGVRTFPSGYIYTGYYKAGLSHGYGKCTFPSGDIYEGDWYEGLMDGLGKYQHKQNGDVYEGMFQRGKRHGPGRYRYRNQRTDVIEYEDGERVGPGVRWSLDGKKAWMLDGKKVIGKLNLESAMKLQDEICVDTIKIMDDRVLVHHRSSRQLCSPRRNS